MISPIVNKLFATKPKGTLYHYTSLKGAMGIIESGSIRATEIRFFSDAAEIKHMFNLLRDGMTRFSLRLEYELTNWLSKRLTHKHRLFVASFTANGNLLSQWRSYSPAAKGINLGFNAAKLHASATRQSYEIGKCIYDPKIQNSVVTAILKRIGALAKLREKTIDPLSEYTGTSYYDVFDEVAVDLLRIAALLKHPSFHEEEEWRVVSPIITNLEEVPIEYREGASMLVPFMNFRLPEASNACLDLERVTLGPTPNVDISMMSLADYFSSKGVTPRKGLAYCHIPYRPW